jgi:hypothetical protein
METVNLKNQRLRARNTRAFTWLRRISLPAYWKCGKIVGSVGVVVLAVLFIMGHIPHPAIVAVILHITADFTLQSPEMALRKHERGSHLLVHALVAGGLPLAVAGLVHGNPYIVLIWTAIGVVGHYAVDWTRRFGLSDTPLGIVLDQAAHLAIILSLVLLVRF